MQQIRVFPNEIIVKSRKTATITRKNSRFNRRTQKTSENTRRRKSAVSITTQCSYQTKSSQSNQISGKSR
jgi:hypothetical protein